MRIALITAGAGGMYCGSCMRDNALTIALREAGHDAILIPTYTPIRTDEVNASRPDLFLGGINVYLQQKFSLFRHTPEFIDRLLNRPSLLRWVSRRTTSIDYSTLGALTLSMLRGRDGLQRKELAKLIRWLKIELKPDIVVMSNALLSGIVPAVKDELQIPIVTTLQGDDLFLGALPHADRQACLEQIRANDQSTSGYIATSAAYADHMAEYLAIGRHKIEVVLPGINVKDFDVPRPDRTRALPTIGYFARICREKGFHNLVSGFIQMRLSLNSPPARLRVSGWLGEGDKAFFTAETDRLHQAGLIKDFDHIECPTREDKVRFMQSIDFLSVPTAFHEPKGLYVLEALASGVPVVQPRLGIFPELIEATGGGLLTTPGDPIDLASAFREMCMNVEAREMFGKRGQEAVREKFTSKTMAEATISALRRFRN